jgi:glycosyltransferase involved in cell wall biosynthesis
MNFEPVMDDPSRPLISVIIHNYDGKHLRKCFDSIFEQTAIDNIEVILADDASSDGSWDLAQEYAHKYSHIITMTRNKRSIGHQDTLYICKRIAKGKYHVPLYNDQCHLPEYVKQCITTMESDPFAEFTPVQRAVDIPVLLPNITSKPLVSITVHNYNYGRYLRQCLDSVFGQTYDNIELSFSDNASSDDSWNIALEYARRYPGMMTLTRNRKNFGSHANFSNCLFSISGKYLVELCSDDALMPEFVERCVNALESNPKAAFAMVHRCIIDEHGRRTEEPPFYNQSCIIPGPEQAAVYMMASVNPSVSQIMYSREKIHGKQVTGGVGALWYGTRIMDFNVCCEYPIVYIKDPLLMQRLHSQNDGFRVADNMIDIIGPYVLQHQFAETASTYNHTKVVERLPGSLEKLSHLCLRYSVRFLTLNDEQRALKYFHLSLAIMPNILADPVFKRIDEYWSASPEDKPEIVRSLNTTDNLLTRSVSYDPPPGSVPLEVNQQHSLLKR